MAAYLGLAAAWAMPLFVDGQRVRLPRSAAELVRAHPLLEVSGPTGAAERVGSLQPGCRCAFTGDLLRPGSERLGNLRKVAQHAATGHCPSPHLHRRCRAPTGRPRIILPAADGCGRRPQASACPFSSPVAWGAGLFLARSIGFARKFLGPLLSWSFPSRGLSVQAVETRIPHASWEPTLPRTSRSAVQEGTCFLTSYCLERCPLSPKEPGVRKAF